MVATRNAAHSGKLQQCCHHSGVVCVHVSYLLTWVRNVGVKAGVKRLTKVCLLKIIALVTKIQYLLEMDGCYCARVSAIFTANVYVFDPEKQEVLKCCSKDIYIEVTPCTCSLNNQLLQSTVNSVRVPHEHCA